MERTGLREMAGPGSESELILEANKLAQRLSAIVQERQPMNLGAVLLAIDCVRGAIKEMANNSETPEDDRERFWAGYHAMAASVSVGRPRDPRLDTTYRKDLALGSVHMTTTAYPEKLVTAEDSHELFRRQAAAIREFADMLDAASTKP